MEATAETALRRFARTLPGTVLATDSFPGGAYPQPRAVAVGMAEIAPDPPGWLTAIRLDVDRDGAGGSWIEAALPPPNFAIVRPSNGHAQLIWLLAVWVRLDSEPERAYADAVRRAMGEAIVADPAYAGRFHHNPLCDRYVTRVGRDEPYTLAELATHVDLYLPRPREPFSPAPIVTGIGRNNDVFESVRRWAYRAVRRYRARDAAEGFTAFEIAVAERAAAVNESTAREYPERGLLAVRELNGIVKSIAGWTWRKYAGRSSPALAAAHTIVAQARARKRALEARRLAGATSREAYLGRTAERRADAVRLAADGMSTAQIATALSVSVRTVRNYLASSRQSPCVASGVLAAGTDAATRIAEISESENAEVSYVEPFSEANRLSARPAIGEVWCSGEFGFPFAPRELAKPPLAVVHWRSTSAADSQSDDVVLESLSWMPPRGAVRGAVPRRFGNGGFNRSERR